MSFTSIGETKKYNNIRKIKYSTTEQKTYGTFHKDYKLKNDDRATPHAQVLNTKLRISQINPICIAEE